MKKLEITAFDLAQRFVGVAEIPGTLSNPMILSMLRLDQQWPTGEEVAWCSAFVNFIAWELRLPRSYSLAARSWLNIGQEVDLKNAEVGFDVVILKRGTGEQPGPDVIHAPGHVGFFAGSSGNSIMVLGGNQGDAVNVKIFPQAQILSIRRIV